MDSLSGWLEQLRLRLRLTPKDVDGRDDADLIGDSFASGEADPSDGVHGSDAAPSIADTSLTDTLRKFLRQATDALLEREPWSWIALACAALASAICCFLRGREQTRPLNTRELPARQYARLREDGDASDEESDRYEEEDRYNAVTPLGPPPPPIFIPTPADSPPKASQRSRSPPKLRLEPTPRLSRLEEMRAKLRQVGKATPIELLPSHRKVPFMTPRERYLMEAASQQDAVAYLEEARLKLRRTGRSSQERATAQRRIERDPRVPPLLIPGSPNPMMLVEAARLPPPNHAQQAANVSVPSLPAPEDDGSFSA